jgi:hypothetical protein
MEKEDRAIVNGTFESLHTLLHSNKWKQIFMEKGNITIFIYLLSF